jgi:hypothetical protein
MPQPTSAGDGRGRAGARLVPLEHNGQPRMDLGLRTKVRTVPDRHDNAEADTKVERVVVPRDNAAQCGRLTEQPMSAFRAQRLDTLGIGGSRKQDLPLTPPLMR